MRYTVYEIRPCIETADARGSGEVESFVSEDDWHAAIEREDANGGNYKTFWTIYGRYDDGDGCMLADAIGDFTTKEGAIQTLNAILGAFRKAIELIEGPEIDGDNGAIVTGPEQAADYLRQIIQSVNISA